MSAQTYNTAMPPPPRRYPFSSAANHQQVNQQRHHAPGSPPPAKAPLVPEKPKQPSSPPLPRQNAKVTPPSPPKIIADKTGSLQFYRVGMLGEGGFARVYEVKDAQGSRCACKVVTKSSLKTKKAKTKLYAEIKIHRALNHPNIVKFQDCFEDDENVYMTLELCHNGSLMDMLRRRRRFTEPEARFFMVQLIGACYYMHTHQVIHRDLKLGNIFLDSNMNVKVGDFGLAALIENPGERKKTICGTPNYIAPEVLFDTANGHSFEVDTWSIGVILYTLVIGRPPFQTKDVKAIYKRIRDNEYEFPTDRVVSSQVRELVQQILTPDPQQRPTLHEIVDHVFFTAGIVPSSIPNTAHDAPPDFSYISPSVSSLNLARLRKNALLDEDTTSINVPSAPPAATASSSSSSLRDGGKLKGVTSSLAQQEKEFQRAVQPGSPISALLSSARQPLLVAPGTARGEQPLLRKLQAAREAKSPGRPIRENNNGVPNRLGGLRGIQEEDDIGARQEEVRRKELESQKARIVAQMVPAPGGTGEEDQENIPPLGITHYILAKAKADRLAAKKEKERAAKEDPIPAVIPAPAVANNAGVTLRPNGFDAAAQTLTTAFDAMAIGKLFRDPRADKDLPDPKVFIVSWVDYCNKYGMGYALTDGSVGVHFNDSTTIVLSPDKCHFDYVSSRRQGSVYVRKNHTVTEYPEDLKSKVYLLKHFEKYIMDRLYGDYEYTFDDTERTRGMDFVQKYLRMKHVIVFKMSHDALQFNFYDHSKVILSSQGLLVTHIDKNYKLTRWSLSEIMAQSLRGPSSDPDQAKFHQRLVDKLKYCKEVLVSIRNASTSSNGSPTTSASSPAELGGELGAGFEVANGGGVPRSGSAGQMVTGKASKASLR